MIDWQDWNYKIDNPTVQAYNKVGPDESPNWEYMYRKSSGDIYFYLLGSDGVGQVPGYIDWNKNVGFRLNDPVDGHHYHVAVGWPSWEPYTLGTIDPRLLPLTEFGQPYLHDYITGGSKGDEILTGYGNDHIEGQGGNDILYGGSHDDLIEGGGGDDRIYGDYADYPTYIGDQYWSAPNPAALNPDGTYHQVLNGSDNLQGGNGSDTLFGGGGNDMLNGGDRGQGYTDVLWGESGSDSFFLSYNSKADPGQDDALAQWQALGQHYSGAAAKEVVTKIVDQIAKEEANEFFKSFGGGIILSGAKTAAGDAVVAGVNALFGLTKKSPSPKNGEDVMVVMDFDPREDSLVLPIDFGKSFTVIGKFFPSSAAGDITPQWGLQFSETNPTTGDDKPFAQVFLGQSFLTAAFKDEEGSGGVPVPNMANEHDPYVQAFLEAIITSRVEYDANGIVGDTANNYPFPKTSSSYSDGTPPPEALDQLALFSEDDSRLLVFGAFGPASIVNQYVNNTVPLITGTNMGDVLNVNSVFFNPEDVPGPIPLSTMTSIAKGFDGNDIIFAGAGQDLIYGGDGDDIIYGIGQQSTNLLEIFRGGYGSDRIYLGWTQTAAIADGGDESDPWDIDTVDFSFLSPEIFYDAEGITLRLDLSNVDPSNNNPNGTAFYRGASVDPNRYVVTNMENVVGSPGNDIISGSAEVNVIEGGEGSDLFRGTQSIWANDHLVIDDADILQIEGRTNSLTKNANDPAIVDLGDGTSFSVVFGDGTPAFDGLGNYRFDGDHVLLGRSAALDAAALQMHLGAYEPTARARSADDLVLGTSGDETLKGRGGDDLLHGFDGSDYLAAGKGDDILVGGAGKFDRLRGGEGADIFAFRHELNNGVHEQDLVKDFNPLHDAVNLGGYRVNSYVEMKNSLLLMVGPDEDAILLRGASDVDNVVLLDDRGQQIGPLGLKAVEYEVVVNHMKAGLGLPQDRASSADDLVLGTARGDTLTGRRGDDLLHGFDGSDFLNGGRGDDILVGGAGEFDRLRGGPGADVFAFGSELDNGVREKDLVKDFDPLQDAIDLRGYRVNSYVELKDSLLLMVGPDEDSILLRGVSDIDSVVLLDDQELWIEPDMHEPNNVAQQSYWLA